MTQKSSFDLEDLQYWERHKALRQEVLKEIWERRRFASELRSSPAAPDETGWGVPDWRREDLYPEPGELKLAEGRWEFLRWNHGFRTDFLAGPNLIASRARSLYFEQAYNIESPVDPRLSARDFKQGKVLGENWDQTGVESVPFGCVVIFRDQHVLVADNREMFKLRMDEATPLHLFARLDLSRPLRAQLSELLVRAERERAWRMDLYKKVRIRSGSWRRHEDRWPRYLRVLDAVDAGASKREIGRRLACDPTSRAGRELIEAAERLRHHWPY